MMTISEASEGVAFLNARNTVERAPLSGFLTLSFCWVFSCLRPEGTLGFLVLAAGLALGPWILDRALPRRNWLGFRASQGTYIVNGLLLAGLAYREVAGLELPFLADLPHLSMLLPWSAVILSGLYFVLQFQGWKHRILEGPALRERLDHPPPAPVLEALETFLCALLRPCPGMAWAEFRTSPATPGSGGRFLRLDTDPHGVWRVALQPGFALLASRTTGVLEVVAQGELRIATEEAPPGARETLCLVRWNAHLQEGRIAPDHFQRIRDWNRCRE